MMRDSSLEEKTTPTPNNRRWECHTPIFDSEMAKVMTVAEVRRSFPRFFGTCEECGYHGVQYASWEHFLAGDW